MRPTTIRILFVTVIAAIAATVVWAPDAHADRGPWHSRAAGTAAMWVRFAKDEPARAVELTRGPLRHDIVAIASCTAKIGRTSSATSGKQKLASITCLGENLARLKIDPQWIVMTANKLPTRELQQFAKRFEATARFAVSTHTLGHVVVVLGAPSRRRLPPPVLGLAIDDANLAH